MTDVQEETKQQSVPDLTDTDTGEAPSACIGVDAKGAKLLRLPSGQLAIMRSGTGEDIMRAMRMVGQLRKGENMKMMFGLIAIKTRLLNEGVSVIPTIDGPKDLFEEFKDRSRALTLEDVLNEVPDFDVLILLAEVQNARKKS